MKICKDCRHCPWKPVCRFLHPEGGNNDKYMKPRKPEHIYRGRKENKADKPALYRNEKPALYRNEKPTACRNGNSCQWRPNCRYNHHPVDHSQVQVRQAGQDRDLPARVTKKDSSAQEDNARHCYQDGDCTGDHLVVRTRNPGGYWYEGGMEGCLPQGRGLMEYDEGLYQGEWTMGERHGLGRSEYWDENEYVSQYLGDWEEGRWDGEGVTVLRNGKVYDGVFKHNCRSGRGKLTMISGSSVQGDWRRCRLVGEGTVTVADEDAEEVLGTGKIVLEGFEKENWFIDCEQTELYDDFLENVVEDVGRMISRGCEGPFVISNRSSHLEDEKVGEKRHEVYVAQMKQMLDNFKI